MRVVLLAHEKFTKMGGKTARGVYFYSSHEIVGIIDRTLSGRYADEFFPGRRHVRIYSNIEEIKDDYDALIIGVAPIGGKLPDAWRDEIKYALEHGKKVISGLHDFLSEDSEFKKIAEISGAEIWDVRKPPETLRVADGSGRGVNSVLIAGTDCSVGKMITAVELTNEARRRGVNAGFVATGQTGIMVGADAGYVLDRIPGDFMAGAMEELVVNVAKNKEIVFVEGQGALTHPAYSGVTLAILHGSYPKKIILAHDPKRKEHHDYPGFKIPNLEWQIETYERLAEKVSGGKVVGIAVDGEKMSDEEYEKYRNIMEEKLGMPVVDVLRDGAGRLFDKLQENFKR